MPATLRQIVNKSVELKTAFDATISIRAQRDAAALSLSALESQLTTAQTTQNTLEQELRTLVNQP